MVPYSTLEESQDTPGCHSTLVENYHAKQSSVFSVNNDTQVLNLY